MLNEKQISALEAKGFMRWTKGNMDRLYINAETLGLEVERYKTGNVSSAYYRGERISNSRGSAMAYAKTYIDVNTGILKSDNCTLEKDARDIYDETMEAVEVESKEAAKAMNDRPYKDITDEELHAVYQETSDLVYGLYSTATEAEREEGLKKLHDINMEYFNRGYELSESGASREGVEDDLAALMEELAEAEADIEGTGLNMLYQIKALIQECQDTLVYMDTMQ